MSEYNGEQEKQGTKTLRGKYRITRNIFVACYLDVLDASGANMQTYIGLKKRSDTVVPVGTQIFLNAETINQINARRSNTYDIFSVTVQEVEDRGGRALHTCTPILKETRPDLRKLERMPSNFPVGLEGIRAGFIARSGNVGGLTLHYVARRAMLSLTLNKEYGFTVTYKDEDYVLPGEIRHIQYDWKNHDHVVGVAFPKLSKEQQVILNLLIDPEFTIDISGKQTVDSAAGKISQEDM